jgi:GMP synthase (glutamine-hydrolysing)
MHIGILQTGHVPDEVAARDGTYSDLFAHRDLTFTTWSVVDMDFPEDAQAAQGWLVTGSRHGAYEDHPFIPPLEALIRAIRDAEKPLVGICFGHQIIAQALGGRVEKFAGGWAVGRKTYRIGGREVALNAWHQDQVVELPPGAQVLGGNDFTCNAFLAMGDRILTVQPHPEFPASVVEMLAEHRAATVPAPLVEAARESLPLPTENRLIADWLADVLEGAPATRIPFAEKARA